MRRLVRVGGRREERGIDKKCVGVCVIEREDITQA